MVCYVNMRGEGTSEYEQKQTVASDPEELRLRGKSAAKPPITQPEVRAPTFKEVSVRVNLMLRVNEMEDR